MRKWHESARGARTQGLCASALAFSSILLSIGPAQAGGELCAPGSQSSTEGYQRVEQRLNSFTQSDQERAALAIDATGGSVVVWQSRRQEDGGYGVYARRLAADGAPLCAETRINATTRSMQMWPAVAIDGAGANWFAWGSYGQDGDQGAVVVRRFAPDLSSATAESVANEVHLGDQRDPAIVGLTDGGALVVWSSHDGLQSHIEARAFDGDGKARGPAFRIDDGGFPRNELPTIGRDAADRITIAWSSADAAGRPQAILARSLTLDGQGLGSVLTLSTNPSAMPIEPTLAVQANGDCVVGWLENAGDSHALCYRRMHREADAWQLGAAMELATPGAGYLTGLAVDTNACGELLFAWNRHAEGEAMEASVEAQRIGADDQPVAESFLVCKEQAGQQRLASASGAQRVRLLDDGRMYFAWQGDAQLGDTSAAHLTLLAPPGYELSVASALESQVGPHFQDLNAAAPHEPPTFDRHDRVAPEVDISSPLAGGDFDFLAVSNTGWTPPDPHMAVGPGHIVVMTNGEIAIFDKQGNNLFRDEIEDSFGFWGAQGATGFVFDPEVIYDPHTDRFMAMACERASGGGNHGFYLLAISDDSNPVGNWFKYRIDSFATINDTDIDSPNIAVDDSVIYLSADFFGPDRLNIIMVDKSSVLNGGSPTFTSTNISGDQSQGFPVTYDTAAPAQYMIGFKFSTATTVRMYAIQNALTTPVVTSLDVSVPSYGHPEDPPQMGTSVRPETFEARFWSAVYRNGRLWATHHVNGSRVRQRWYEFDMANWPISGTPTLVQSGEIDLGGTVRTYFGSLWVDNANNMGIVYARSSPTEFISMERTWRAASDPLGTTRAPVQIQPSTSGDTSGRWGDYSSTSDDPADPGQFWGHHEYRDSTWRTRVGRWSICDGTVSNYCLTSPNSVGSGAIIGNSGSTSIAANDFGLFATGCPANQFGLFFYGATQGQSSFGNGFKCVDGQLFRLPLLSVDSFGVATQAIDYNNLPVGGQISAGSTWNFQFWYRDPMGGGAAFNLSDGLSASYCP